MSDAWGAKPRYSTSNGVRACISEVVVVVPAADEEECIGACLDAIQAAIERMDVAVRARIVVVLDACGDGTADEVARYPDVEVVGSTARRVGTARALGAAHAIRTSGAGPRLWLANTDADSVVPLEWLVRMLAAADAGADLVLGTVVPGPGLSDGHAATWSRLHDAHDGHPHVHGANLGIRADTLTALGGWRPLATGEDVDLADRAVSAGASIVRTAAIAVSTSARAAGRAPDGFSGYLRALA